MRKQISFLMLAVLWMSSCLMTKGYCSSSWKDYIYDDQGVAQFVKVYIGQQETNSLNKPTTDHFAFNLLMQQDQTGSYLAVPIRKHQDDDDDNDDDYWICPHCGRKNPASRHSCATKGCPFYGRS